MLGSVHWLAGAMVDHPDYPVWEAYSVAEVWRLYFEELRAAAGSGLYDVMAHPDLPKVFGERPPGGVPQREYDDTADAFAAAGVACEISSAGLRKAAGELYPVAGLPGGVRRAGRPDHARRGRAPARGRGSQGLERAVRLATDAGYRTVTAFRGPRAAPGAARVSYRVGTGFDAHRLVEGRPLVLGGVAIEHHLGLEGHSDADVVCHALIDAVLGASALGDIGDLFPPGDPRFAGAASIDLLARAWQDVARRRLRARQLRRGRGGAGAADRPAPDGDARADRAGARLRGRPGVRARHGHGRAGLRRARRRDGVPGRRAPPAFPMTYPTSSPRSIASVPSTQTLASAITPSTWIADSLSPP